MSRSSPKSNGSIPEATLKSVAIWKVKTLMTLRGNLDSLGIGEVSPGKRDVSPLLVSSSHAQLTHSTLWCGKQCGTQYAGGAGQ